MMKRIKHTDGYILLYDTETKTQILEHRYVMEQHLGRKLESYETVHHKDHNKENNSLDNLELMDNSEHVRMHQLDHGRLYVKLRCPQCGNEFDIPKNRSYLQKNYKYNCTCCSKECRGMLYKRIQMFGVTDDIRYAMDRNLIKEYVKYQQ